MKGGGIRCFPRQLLEAAPYSLEEVATVTTKASSTSRSRQSSSRGVPKMGRPPREVWKAKRTMVANIARARYL